MPEARDYTSQAPDFSSGDATDQAERVRMADQAAAALQKALKEGRFQAEEDADLRVFVAPLEPTTRFLVKAGTVIWFRSETSPTGRRDMDREGDVWAQFAGGICATRDPEVIDWCEAHSGDKDLHNAYHAANGTKARECSVDVGLCRDTDWEASSAWAEMKVLQSPTSRRSQQLPTNMDIDKLFSRISPNIGHGDEGERVINAAVAARNADRERSKGR